MPAPAKIGDKIAEMNGAYDAKFDDAFELVYEAGTPSAIVTDEKSGRAIEMTTDRNAVIFFITNPAVADLDFSAESDEDTLYNPTSHAYFNPAGIDTDARELTLQLKSPRHLEFREDQIPTGKLLETAGTPFDFQNLKANEGKNALHGGEDNFATRNWDFTVDEAAGSVTFTTTMTEADDNFPGTMPTSLTYTFTDNDEVRSNGHKLGLVSWGASWQFLQTKAGDELVLAYKDAQGYWDHAYFLGNAIGRVAGRIDGASFELNGKTVQCQLV
ncbi:hypothetical protein H7R52_06320 [Weissella confusa]|uniref:Uncharacterized protein n=1 Tax=Weissella confusa TaxID=1583 RepID=A0A923NHL0_WEICO|nr:hypothetical protein [Weissella confusa]